MEKVYSTPMRLMKEFFCVTFQKSTNEPLKYRNINSSAVDIILHGACQKATLIHNTYPVQ